MKRSDYSLHFIGNAGAGDDLEVLRHLPWDDGWYPCVHHAWVWPVFCHLRDSGFDVSYGLQAKDGAVNFVHGEVARYQLTGNDFRNCFTVGIRADFRPVFYSNIEVVQNKNSAGARSHYMPHFPQPGLRPRDPARTGVENICFSGQLENFGPGCKRFEKDLAKMGCRFVLKDPKHWGDMSDVDVLLGVRALDKNPFDTKPATKMFNAWLAEIPFIGGYDSAYEHEGRPGIDYLQISSYKEMLEQIRLLKNDVAFYQRLVDAGRVAGKKYTHVETGKRWEKLVEDVVAPAYQDWKEHDSSARLNATLRGIVFEVWEQYIRRYKRSSVWGD